MSDMTSVDESAADDGGIYAFWEFIVRRRRARRPEFDLEDVGQLVEAIRRFEARDES